MIAIAHRPHKNKQHFCVHSKPVFESYPRIEFGDTWKGMLCSGTTFFFSRTTTVLPTMSRYEYLVCKSSNIKPF
jgi:hypothetical protein